MDAFETPTLDADARRRIEDRLHSGRYASMREVMQAALGALDREEKAYDETLRRKVEGALDDPRPSIPAEEVFAELRSCRAEGVKDTRRDA